MLFDRVVTVAEEEMCDTLDTAGVTMVDMRDMLSEVFHALLVQSHNVLD